MSIAPNSKYLESKVLTASQPQLHLMLLEGAVRFGQKAVSLWGDEPESASLDALVDRMVNIVEELSNSTTGRDNEISVQLEEEYAFLYRELTASRMNSDLPKFEKCLEILSYQRDTWKQACESIEFVTDTATAAPKSVPMPIPHTPMSPGVSSFSLDA